LFLEGRQMSNNNLEFTGDSIDEAVARGCEALGVKPGDFIVEVLEEPHRGVFGIGARPARVRLKLLRPPTPATPPPPPAPTRQEDERKSDERRSDDRRGEPRRGDRRGGDRRGGERSGERSSDRRGDSRGGDRRRGDRPGGGQRRENW